MAGSARIHSEQVMGVLATVTCAGAASTSAMLAYDNQGQLAAWQNAPSSPTSTASFLYDGEGNRVEQVATTSGTTTTTSYLGNLLVADRRDGQHA